MKKFLLGSLILTQAINSFPIIFSPQTANATIPKYINFQGKLTKVSDGTNMANGTYAFEFKIYDAVTAGSLLWTETYDQGSGACGKLTVTSGVFNAKLGSCSALTIDMTGGALYISVNFAPTGTSYDGEMSPRKQLVAAPYAFVANSLNGDGTVDLADFDVDSDGKTTIAPDTAGDTLTISHTATADIQGIVISSSNSTQTAGTIQVTSNTVTDTAVLGLALAGTVQDAAGALTVYGNKTTLTVDTDAGSNHTAYGTHITIDNDDAGSTVYGLYVDADGDGGGEGTEYSAIFVDGNVGVGTTTPGSLLDIRDNANQIPISIRKTQSGTSSGSAIAFYGGASGTTVRGYVGTNSENGAFTFFSSGELANAIAIRGESGIQLGVSSNAALTIDGNSNIGIGTTSPSSLLTIGSGTPTTATSGLNFGTDTSANLYRSASGRIKTDGDLHIAGDDLFMGTNTDAFILVADGTNFNPVAMSGDITITNSGATAIGNDKVVEADLKAVDTASDEECLTYETTTGDFEWQACGGGSGTVNTGVAGYFSYYPSNGTTVDDQTILYTDGTNVGIGTTSPQGKLDVKGVGYFADTNNAVPYAISVGASASSYGAVGFNMKFGAANSYTYGGNDYSSQVFFGSGGIKLRTAPSGTAGNAITYTDAVTILQAGNVGIGDPSPASLLAVGSGDLFQVDSSGRLFLPAGASGAGNLAFSTTGDTNTGLYFSAADEIRIQTGGTDRVTINSSGNLGLGTSPGSRLDVANTAIANAGKLAQFTGVLTTSTASGTGYGLYNSLSNANSTNADTAYSIYNTVTDATALANTVYGTYNTIALSGNAAKTGIGDYTTVTTSSTTADTLVALDVASTVTGIMTTGTRNVYGARLQPTAGAESTGGTTNVYGAYIKADADVAAGGTVVGYGLYIANGAYDTDGTSTQYGLYVESPTGADTNYAAIFAGGNVGIGTTAPTQKLIINNSADNTVFLQTWVAGSARHSFSTDGSANALIRTGNNVDLRLGVNEDAISIKNGGNVGIGTSTVSSSKLQVYGTIWAQNGELWASSMAAKTTSMCQDGGVVGVCTSDRRLKENIRYWDSNVNGLDVIGLLKPATFDWISGDKDAAGFIAQDVQAVLPNIVKTKTTDGYWAFSRELLVPYTVKAIQDISLLRLQAKDTASIAPGSVVGFDDEEQDKISTKTNTTNRIIGIATTQENIEESSEVTSQQAYIVQTTGKTLVLISSENGTIRPGDYLTPSSTKPGYAMKAVTAGTVIGQALESFASSQCQIVNVPCAADKIIVFVNVHYRAPNVSELIQNSDTSQTDADLQTLFTDLQNLNLLDASVFGNIAVEGSVYVQKDLHVKGIIIAAEVQTNKLTTKELCLEDVCVNKQQLQQLLQLINSGQANSSSSGGSINNEEVNPSPQPPPNEPSPDQHGEVAGSSDPPPSETNP